MSQTPIEDMGHDELEVRLAANLAVRTWFDVTEEHNPDPSAVQCYATGHVGRRNGETIYMLSRYEDDGEDFALVCKMRGEAKRIGMEQFKLQWLWEKIAAMEGKSQ